MPGVDRLAGAQLMRQRQTQYTFIDLDDAFVDVSITEISTSCISWMLYVRGSQIYYIMLSRVKRSLITVSSSLAVRGSADWLNTALALSEFEDR